MLLRRFRKAVSALRSRDSTVFDPEAQTRRELVEVKRLGCSVEMLESRQLLSGNTADQTTPTAWYYFHGASLAALNQTITQNNARIVDFQVDNPATPTFSATLVQNTGAYASGWWWYYNVNSTQLNSAINTNHARIASLSTYVVGGKTEFAAVLTPNTGAQAKAWWWYIGQTSSQIASELKTNNARLVDEDAYTLNGKTLHSAVMISNTGSDAKTWYWYVGQTPAQIASRLNANNARLTNIEADGSGKFDVIMQKNDGVQWFWYYGQSTSSLGALAAQDGGRILEVEPYTSGTSTFLAGIVVNNSNATETTVGNILRASNASATTGAYLKQVGGPVLASLEANTKFEPASAIKIVLEVTALRAIQAGTAKLSDSLFYFFKPGDPTNVGVNPDSYPHTAANRAKTTIGNAMTQMLEVSDNRMTQALEQRFTRSAINATAHLIGMNNTVWASTLGSGVPGNFLTLADAGLLYEKVLNGSLLNSTGVNTLESEIINQTNFGLGNYAAIVLQEAAAVLGVSTTNSKASTLANKFLAAMKWGAKGGSYDLGISSSTFEVVRTEAGYLGLPMEKNGKIVKTQYYVYGEFVDKAIVPVVPTGADNPAVDKVNNAMHTAVGELARQIIHDALLTWV